MAGSGLRAGAAEVDVTPPMGVEMCGYGPYEKRLCTEVLDPLRARALWLENSQAQVAIVSLDVCSIDAGVRERVAAELKQLCGIDDRHLLLAATHTHSGPAVQEMIGWGRRHPDYLNVLVERTVRAVAEARDAAEPARIGSARQGVRDVGVNRVQRGLGPIDTAAQLMRIDRADGAPLAAVVNFGAHAAVRYPYTSRVSADWPGALAAYLKVAMGGATALFLQAPCGNVNAHEMTFDRTDVGTNQQVCDLRVGEMVRRFGGQIIPALKDIQTAPTAALTAAWKTVSLPREQPERRHLQERIAAAQPTAESMTPEQLRPLHERIADETQAEIAWRKARFEVDACRRQLELLDRPPHRLEAPIQVLGVGAAAIVGWPAEVFVELGLQLRQRSPVPLTFVASVANDNVGYVPTEAAYESQGRPNAFGGYSTTMTPLICARLPFRKDVGRILVNETLDLLGELRLMWS